MLIDDEAALRDWLIVTLEPLCDAEPDALARYVLALVAKDKPLDKLRENCVDRLEVFLDRATKDFVEQLFDVISNRKYISDGKKENVQPKPAENTTDLSQMPLQHTLPPATKEKEGELQSTAIPTTSPSVPVKRRYSSRHADNHRQRSTGSPTAKRTQRSYSHSSTGSSSPPSPTNLNKVPCKDFSDNKDSYAPQDAIPDNHAAHTLTFDQQNYYPTHQQHYDMPSSHLHQPYNPEAPDLRYDLHQRSSMYARQPLPPGQRTLVTVVTNAEPLPLEQKLRQGDSGGPMARTKRHVTTGPYPTDRRNQQRDPQGRNDGHQNRGRRRPWQKPDGSASGSTTLEIRKIPVESNTISKINEHFSKFGTVTNVQIAFDGSPDCALVAYGTFQEAETAYKNPEPLFNNRFIKIFWHNANKAQNTPSAPPAASDTPQPNSLKHHWTKVPKPSPTKVEGSADASTVNHGFPPARLTTKKKATIASGPSSIKKEAAKKAAIEIRRKKQGLLEGQIQQQKLLLKKLEAADTNEEKESIRSLMKQVDTTIVTLKDSLHTAPVKSAEVKVSQQDLLKQRAETLKKQIESLRAKTSADMRRAMSSTLETKLPNQINELDADEELHLLAGQDQLTSENGQASKQHYELETHDEAHLLDS